MRVLPTSRSIVPYVVGAALATLTLVAINCGDGNDNRPAPVPTFTPARFQCSGPEGPATTCDAPNMCCGNQCISAFGLCCEIPAGRPNAGNKFSCAKNQQCCGTGCVQTGSPCS